MPEEGTPELERFGEIYEDVPTDLPLGVVQEAWDRAMSECRRQRVFAIQRCENVVVRPSQQVCETASSINVPSSVRLECCVFGGTYPNDCAFPGTKATFTVDPGDYGAPDSYTPNLPPGLFDRLPLDARPTETISRHFDAGAEVSALIQYEAGLDLTLDADPGSVDVTYTTDIMLEATAAAAVPGDIVTVTGR